jgi:hypothetical protein
MGMIPHNFKHADDPDAQRICEFSAEHNPSNAYAAPTGDATWTKYTSNTSASVLAALEDAGYQLWEFNTNTYRVPMFLNS